MLIFGLFGPYFEKQVKNNLPLLDVSALLQVKIPREKFFSPLFACGRIFLYLHSDINKNFRKVTKTFYTFF